MKVVGLVTEYNPFHNGHLHHLLESKTSTDATHSIAVMSGHFLQRGEPAIIDKWSRAKAAVDAGVDLVLEIPTLFACSSAEYFSYGSVSLLDQLNIVDQICFGSENGTLDKMQEIAKLLNKKDNTLQDLIGSYLKSGLSYPKAREHAINDITQETFTFMPNNILGIEYLKALENLNSPIRPATIKRIQADYMSTKLEGTIASATGIRKSLQSHHNLNDIKDFVPPATYEMIKNHFDRLIYKEDLTDFLLYKIRTSSLEAIRNIHDVTEGIEHKIKKVAERVSTYHDLLDGIVSKRYTRTRVQRIFIKILLDVTSDQLRTDNFLDAKYARILAFNQKGQDLIKKIKKASDFPLITNINKVDLDVHAQSMLDFDIKATNVYNLLYKDKINKRGGTDYTQTPYRRTK